MRGTKLPPSPGRCFLFPIVLVLFFVVVVRADCPPSKDCGPFGECIMDTRSCGNDCKESCKCQPGYVGEDCSMKVERCEDATGPESVDACYNNGRCYMTEDVRDDSTVLIWKCDCRESYGEARRYAGHMCEYPAEASCERGNDASEYAFCVNGGRCVRLVERSERHPGCECKAGYEGRHCQYDVGTAPREELVYMPAPAEVRGMSGLVLFFVVVASLTFVGGVAFFGWNHHSNRSGGKESDTAVGDGPTDLELREERGGGEEEEGEFQVAPQSPSSANAADTDGDHQREII